MHKIAILLPNLGGGGAERIHLDLAREFQKMGYLVELVLMQTRGELLEEARKAFSIIDLDIGRVRHLPLALARYLRQRRPDALLTAMWPLTAIAPLVRLFSGRCRVVISERSILSLQYRSSGRMSWVAMRASMALGYRAADARIGVSKGVVRDMAALSGMRENEFCVVYNPLPLRPSPTTEALAATEALWGVKRGARILTVGSFKAAKDHPLLLRSFARIAAADARLMFVGAGEGEGSLRALAEELGVADRVVFAGFHTDPTPFYATADLFVLSSNREGFGNVIVEALACGLPVVSTDCPSGPAEILDRGRFGRLVPVGDEGALAEAMTAALAEPHDRERLQARSRDFAPKDIARRYLDLLHPNSTAGSA